MRKIGKKDDKKETTHIHQKKDESQSLISLYEHVKRRKRKFADERANKNVFYKPIG